MSRLIIASNRLPVTAVARGGELVLRPSAGGLATAMRGVHESGQSLWIGYAGDMAKLSQEQKDHHAR